MAMERLYVIVLRISKTLSKVVLTLAILLLMYVYFLTLHGSTVEDDADPLLPDLPIAARRSRLAVDWDEVQSTEEREYLQVFRYTFDLLIKLHCVRACTCAPRVCNYCMYAYIYKG